MELSRISALLCICLLALCLSLSVCTVIVLRSTVDESERIRADVEVFLEKLTEPSANSSPTTEALPTDAPPTGFYLQESLGRIGVFTVNGEPVRTFDIPVSMLPEADRHALAEGIYLSDWKDVLKLIGDLS